MEGTEERRQWMVRLREDGGVGGMEEIVRKRGRRV